MDHAKLDVVLAACDNLSSRMDNMERRADATMTPEEAYRRAYNSFKAEDLRRDIANARQIANDPKNGTMGSFWTPKQIEKARSNMRAAEQELEAWLGPLRRAAGR